MMNSGEKVPPLPLSVGPPGDQEEGNGVQGPQPTSQSSLKARGGRQETEALLYSALGYLPAPAMSSLPDTWRPREGRERQEVCPGPAGQKIKS